MCLNLQVVKPQICEAVASNLMTGNWMTRMTLWSVYFHMVEFNHWSGLDFPRPPPFTEYSWFNEKSGNTGAFHKYNDGMMEIVHY